MDITTKRLSPLTVRGTERKNYLLTKARMQAIKDINAEVSKEQNSNYRAKERWFYQSYRITEKQLMCSPEEFKECLPIVQILHL